MKKTVRKKIERLGKRQIKATISNMQLTLEGYKNKSYSIACKLCYYGCGRKCAWVIMTGLTCSTYMHENYIEIYNSPESWEDLRAGKNLKWRTLRMRQLKAWIKIWQEVLEGME